MKAASEIRIGLVNNMPTAARNATTRQFRDLLHAAAGSTLIRLKLFSMTEHHDDADPSIVYAPVETIFHAGIDALIFTGAEPTKADLRDEPYWPRLSQLFDWTEENGVPAILSCLAGHAAALHFDGIARRPLTEKCFGVFDETVYTDHPLLDGLPGKLKIPHSRWNELPPQDLVDAGYQVLTYSASAGADIFVRQGRSLLLYFQGHPEYEANRLWLEYRRDARRFIAGMLRDYPNLPHGYFDSPTEKILTAFRQTVMHANSNVSEIDFPATVTAPRYASWRPGAERVVRNWFRFVCGHA
jgi:homoserine O-succinyltransferase